MSCSSWWRNCCFAFVLCIVFSCTKGPKNDDEGEGGFGLFDSKKKAASRSSRTAWSSNTKQMRPDLDISKASQTVEDYQSQATLLATIGPLILGFAFTGMTTATFAQNELVFVYQVLIALSMMSELYCTIGSIFMALFLSTEARLHFRYV